MVSRAHLVNNESARIDARKSSSTFVLSLSVFSRVLPFACEQASDWNHGWFNPGINYRVFFVFFKLSARGYSSQNKD